MANYILLQVHTRILYLRHLIVSLAQARDISKVLLIFSHDYYDEDINDLVKSIDFCKVMQVIYNLCDNYRSLFKINIDIWFIFQIDILSTFNSNTSA